MKKNLSISLKSVIKIIKFDLNDDGAMSMMEEIFEFLPSASLLKHEIIEIGASMALRWKIWGKKHFHRSNYARFLLQEML